MTSALVLACSWISILGSLVVKIPQIVAVLRAGSVRGLSLQSLLLEMTGFSINFSYNAAHQYPLDTYGEFALLLAQDLVLLLLFVQLTGRRPLPWLAGVAAAAGGIYAVSTRVVPLTVAKMLILMALPLGWSSKVVQLRAILSSRDARSVSLLTWTLAALTCGTRIVTTLAGTQDATLLTCFVVNMLLSSVIAAAAYRHRLGPDGKAGKKE